MKESESANAVTIINTKEPIDTLKKVSPENGLSIEAWNYDSNQNFQLTNADTKHKPFSLYIFYLLTPGSLSLAKKLLDKRRNREQHDSTMFFTMGNTPITFEVKAEKPFRALVIKADIGWLHKELKSQGVSSEELIGRLIISNSDYGKYSPNEYLLANKLYNHLTVNNTDKMFILSRIFLLLSDFFERIFANSSTSFSNVPVEYYNRMLQVESIILSSIKRKPHSLTEIANKIEMTESKLKRYFRKVFGNNVYEYYMTAKMDVAKRMLIEKKISVAQVSELLGYETSKCFTTSFKKHFSYSPGDVLKSSQNYISN